MTPDLIAMAAVWLTVRGRTEKNPEIEAAFDQWIKANPAHARAYEKVLNAWDMSGALVF